jgi:hypothetical protein
MKTSKDILKQAHIVPKLKLAIRKTNDAGKEVVVGTGPHRVKILSDKVGMDKDRNTGKPRHVVIYYFKWNGEDRMYKVPVKNEEGDIHYLVQRFAECNEGDELILEYKRKGVKGYIEVLPVNGVSSIEVGDEEENDSVPDIDLDDDAKESGDSKGKGDDEADIQISDTL